MNVKRSEAIESILKEADQKELTGAEIAALTILGLNPIAFGIPGVAILKLICDLTNYKELKYIVSKHEAEAVFAASGYSAISDLPAFVLVTSGPGVLNSFSGIYDSTLELYPVVVISGNVESYILKNKKLLAFQKSYSAKAGKYLAKSSNLIKKADKIQDCIIDGFIDSYNLPKGAVLIDITRDAFEGKAKFQYFKQPILKEKYKNPEMKLLEKVADLIVNSKRPFLVLGRGAFKARKEIWKFIEDLKLPFCYTLKGKGIMPDDHPQNYKYVGMHGFWATNKALYDADLVIAIGASCDDASFSDPENFTKGKKVVINPYLKNILARIKPDIAIESDAKESILNLSEILSKESYKEKVEKNYDNLVLWHKSLREDFNSDQNKVYNKKNNLLSPVDVSLNLNKSYNPDLLIADVGEHQQHIVRFLDFKALIYDKKDLFGKTTEVFMESFNKSILTSGSAGTMGVAISYTFGALLANSNIDSLTVVGDGSLEMHLPSLWFWASNYNYNYKCLIFNNRQYGEIDEPGFNKCKNKFKYLDTTVSKDKAIIPNFKALSQLYNIDYYYSDNSKNFLENLEKISKLKDTYIFEILVSPLGCYPFMPHNKTVLYTIFKPE